MSDNNVNQGLYGVKEGKRAVVVSQSKIEDCVWLLLLKEDAAAAPSQGIQGYE